jgi:hypothetical protein
VLKVSERRTAELQAPRVSVNACQLGVGFALSSSVVVSLSPELAEVRNGDQRASRVEAE